MSNRRTAEERIVITGMGAVTPLGPNLARSWAAIKSGEHGIQRLSETYLANDEGIAASGAKVAAPAPEVNESNFPFTGEMDLPLKRWHRSSAIGFIAMHEALADARLIDEYHLIDRTKVNRYRAGYYIGSTFSGADELANIIGPDSKRARLGNLFRYLPGRVAMAPAMQLYLGGPGGMIGEECASGGSAIRLGAKELLPYWEYRSDADLMVAGGSDGEISAANLKLFSAIPAVDPTDDPEQASRPFDAQAKGLVMAEAAGALVLETWQSATARGVHEEEVYAELVGMANLTDAANETKAAIEGTRMVIQKVLEMAGIEADETVYINAHATSTSEGDPIEATAIQQAINKARLNRGNFWVTSTKGATGHTMGAAGAIEAAFSVLALRDAVVPPALKLHDPIPETKGLNLSPLVASHLSGIDVAVSTSFGFGGTATALAFRKFKA